MSSRLQIQYHASDDRMTVFPMQITELLMHLHKYFSQLCDRALALNGRTPESLDRGHCVQMLGHRKLGSK